MKTSHLAMVIPIDTAEKNDQSIRAAVWQMATELLLPQLGKRYSRFEPANKAWKQTVNQPFGVVIGRNDPAVFLYFYAAGKSHQEAAIQFHMASFLEGLEPIIKNEQAGVAMYAVQICGDGSDVAPHMLWHVALMNGELLPDCGIYFAQEKRALADDALDKHVLSHLEHYAMCVVTLTLEAEE